MDVPNGQSTEADIAHPGLRARFFERCDWLSFAITACITLVVYLFTLAPEVTLGNEGMMATAGFYGGNGMPPGYPVWCVYAWLFAHLLAISNVAWRMGVSSAVAAAMSSALAALMVSRSGRTILERMRGDDGVEAKEEKPIRTAAGCVAGMAFAFDRTVWERALKVDPWCLTLLLFAIVLCLLMRWHYEPERKRYLYATAFCYGLMLANTQSLIMAAIGIATMVLMADPALGRDVFVTMALLALFAAVLRWFDFLAESVQLRTTFGSISCLSFLVAIIVSVKTRSVFTQWRSVLACGLFLAVGLLPYLLLSVVGMTTPPSHWGYARTAEGFWHLLSRGHYGKAYFTDSFERFWQQIALYAVIAVRHLGLSYILLAAIPFWFFAGCQEWNGAGFWGWLACSFVFLYFG